MENLILAKKILETIMSTPVIVAQDIPRTLAVFEDTHCFHKELQPMHRVSYLSDFVQKMDTKTIAEIHDPLGTIIIMFFIDKNFIIIGPFAENEWDTHDSEKLLASLGIPITHLSAYELYMCRYSVFESAQAMRAATIMIETGGYKVSDYAYQQVKSPFEKNVQSLPTQDKYTYEYVTRRYEIEGEMMRHIQDGNAMEAVDALKRLNSMRQGLDYMKEALWSRAHGATCLRTIIRIAAGQAGLPPIIIDAIAQNYAQKLYSIGINSSSRKSNNFAVDLIKEYCDAIKKYRKYTYSPMVRNAIQLIQLNLSNALSVHSVAEELHISDSHLSKQFKHETGCTISNYIMRERTKKAAELLSTTRLTVQDVSAYVGYLDSNYFVKVFKVHYGMTPTGYRKKYIV